MRRECCMRGWCQETQQKNTVMNEPSEGIDASEKSSSDDIPNKMGIVTKKEGKKHLFKPEPRKAVFDKDMPGKILAVNEVGHLCTTY